MTTAAGSISPGEPRGGDGAWKGPAVIHERVQLLGGELILDSDPRAARGSKSWCRGHSMPEAQVAEIRVLLADDHPILRAGLRKLLEAEPGFRIIGEAPDGSEAVRMAHTLQPDILLLDLAMPRITGLEVFARCAPARSRSARSS